MMPKATWKGVTLAESDQTIVIEGNHYFPPDAVNREYLADSVLTTRCVWKGKASYYDINVDGDINHAAAWYYPEPWILARQIRNYVAFWNGVKITS